MEASNAKCMYFEFHDHTYTGNCFTANVNFGLSTVCVPGTKADHFYAPSLDFSLRLGSLTKSELCKLYIHSQTLQHYAHIKKI